MELSDKVFTCASVVRGDAETLHGVVYVPWLAYWWAECPRPTGGVPVITTTWGVTDMPKENDTRTPEQLGYRKWGHLGGEA